MTPRGGARPGAGRPRTRVPGAYVTRTIEIHKDQDAWLRDEAKACKQSVSELVRQIIDVDRLG